MLQNKKFKTFVVILSIITSYMHGATIAQNAGQVVIANNGNNALAITVFANITHDPVDVHGQDQQQNVFTIAPGTTLSLNDVTYTIIVVGLNRFGLNPDLHGQYNYVDVSIVDSNNGPVAQLWYTNAAEPVTTENILLTKPLFGAHL